MHSISIAIPAEAADRLRERERLERGGRDYVTPCRRR